MRKLFLALLAASVLVVALAWVQSPAAAGDDSAIQLGPPGAQEAVVCSGFGARGQASPAGSGTVSVTSAAGCSGPRYPAGDTLTFTATPAPGYSFGSWSNGTGCSQCVGQGNPCTNFTMPSALVVCIANFV